MVTKAMLQEAAGIAENRRLQSIENMPQVEHQFSARFERKMNRLIRQVEHPVRHTFFRSVAAVLLLVFILFGMVFAISPEVRASVINWVKSTFFEFTQYSANQNTENADFEYYLQFIPEGYSEFRTNDKEEGKTFIYIHEDGHLLKFLYADGNGAHKLSIITDLHTHIESHVNGNKADIYITDSELESNAIVWTDSESGYLFFIGAKADKDQLIALAESVVKK